MVRGLGTNAHPGWAIIGLTTLEGLIFAYLGTPYLLGGCLGRWTHVGAVELCTDPDAAGIAGRKDSARGAARASRPRRGEPAGRTRALSGVPRTWLCKNKYEPEGDSAPAEIPVQSSEQQS